MMSSKFTWSWGNFEGAHLILFLSVKAPTTIIYLAINYFPPPWTCEAHMSAMVMVRRPVGRRQWPMALGSHHCKSVLKKLHVCGRVQPASILSRFGQRSYPGIRSLCRRGNCRPANCTCYRTCAFSTLPQVPSSCSKRMRSTRSHDLGDGREPV
ncbi:hypothetical protein L228DRAFT_128685 [Xylona heveae TC161]|uniref:Uncharacterized protein n=1 Tax=Xylona heveae (strain CBS 132557 / TC161) TaxID=1328760 RepID=A0A165GSY4_XYLHT|nr:hypothetical protein L228DRAFT_128685 [Xylona heveae TC161]KZF22558.1 hypothetical protein L228DRAFT_128685 [Xylona heveae TC161]